MAVKITGLRETLHALNRIKRNFYGFTVHAVNKYTEQLIVVAKDRCGEDTGALKASIGRQIVRKGISEIRGKVFAGHVAFVRGEGRYKKGKDRQEVSRRSTEEYAAAHDKKSGFMKNAADWSNKNAKKAVEKAIEKAIRTF